MNARVFSAGLRTDVVAPDDRGLAYGDGLFETMRAHGGRVPWWDAHWSRLQRGAGRLRIALPDARQVREESERLLAGGDAVLKLLVTRGGGGRGYAPDSAGEPTWMVSRYPVPPAAPAGGIAVRWCATRLAIQPALAGLKHCNRLEQVLARAEWSDEDAPERDAAEGLMRSTEGDVVCATAANLFVFRGGRWWTPAVDRCGVAGVCREWALAALHATETRLGVTDVENAEAVFLCNAVRGILPVNRLGRRTWPAHPRIPAVRQALALDHPAFRITPTENP